MASAGNIQLQRAQAPDGRVGGGETFLSSGAGGLAAPQGALFAKRALDLTVSLLALLALSPVLLGCALAVRVSSPGPILFVQQRVGRGGKRFRMLKFRSMYRNAEQRQQAYTALNECTGPVFKIGNDPRVTPVGRVLRRLSLDELPQLLNVLRGQMSLVGPRPPLPQESATYTAHELHRLLVTPGLTCIWQVSGRSNVDFAQWVEMDLRSIRSWSLWLDLRVLIKTIPTVLTGRGAY